MRHFSSACLTIFLISGPVLADERSTLFKGFGLKLERIVDSMTDERRCALFVDEDSAFGVSAKPVYLAIQGPKKVVIWPRAEGLLFAADAKHLLRIGSDPPRTVTPLTKRNGLTVDGSLAIALIKALASREKVRLRFVKWPSHDSVDVELGNHAVAYVWGRAAKDCGWPPLAIAPELPVPQLVIEEESGGSADASVSGNAQLRLRREIEKYSRKCHLTFGMRRVASFTNGRLSSPPEKLTVRDSDGKVRFEVGTSDPTSSFDATIEAMSQAAPHGSVIVNDDGLSDEFMLYGFSELWKWGVDNCDLGGTRPGEEPQFREPVAVKTVEAVYPEVARKARVQGVVIVEFVVGTDGRVTQARIVKPLPMGLDTAAVDALKRWEFKPALRNGIPVEVSSTMTFTFRLDGKTGTPKP